MPFDFPASPTTGQVFNAPTGQGYVYSGTAWNLAQTSPQAPVASDNPPANPYAGQLWLRSTTGALYMWYTDPNSSQWIQIPGNSALNDPYPFNTANMQLRSKSAGVIGVNSAKDGTGTDVITFSNAGVANFTGGMMDAGGDNVIKLDWASSLLGLTIDGGAQGSIFTTVNSPFNSSGYTKLANGFFLQWGFPNADINGNAIVTFPVAFPNGLAAIVGTLNSGSGIAAGTAHTVSVCNLANGSATLQARTITAGSVVVAASANVRWIAVGY